MESELITWLNTHKMTMNTNKTNYILFHGKKSHGNFADRSMNINLNGVLINRVASNKYLGLIIDEMLEFREHIDAIIPFSYALRRIRNILTPNFTKQFYFAHVYSRLVYLNVIRVATNKLRIQSLFLAQKKFIKAMNGLHWQTRKTHSL
jgi:hypothetical protein